MSIGWYELKNSGDKNVKGDRNYTREFLVVTDNYNPDINEDIFAEIPIAAYESYPDDTYALARSKEVDMISPGFWSVKVKYASEPVDPKKTKNQTNDTKPDQRPWVISYDSVQTEKILLKDYNNIAVVNSAGQMFDPVVTVPSCNPIIRILFYKSRDVFDPSDISYYTDTINLNSFLIDGYSWDQRKLRINKIKADPVQEFGGFWMKLEVEIEVKTPTVVGSTNNALWFPYSVMDCGTHQFPSDLSKPLEPIKDTSGNPSRSQFHSMLDYLCRLLAAWNT